MPATYTFDVFSSLYGFGSVDGDTASRRRHSSARSPDPHDDGLGSGRDGSCVTELNPTDDQQALTVHDAERLGAAGDVPP